MLKNLTDFIGAGISIYMFLLIIRIVMTWFSNRPDDPNGVLARLCDPYLNFYRRMGLVIGHVDFSPLVAITVLVVAQNIFLQIGLQGRVSLGVILAVFTRSFWGAAGSLVFIFIILIVIRLIFLFIKPGAYSQMLGSIDALLAPFASKAASVFMKSGLAGYQTNLIILCVMLIAFYYVGGLAMTYLAGFLASLPF